MPSSLHPVRQTRKRRRYKSAVEQAEVEKSSCRGDGEERTGEEREQHRAHLGTVEFREKNPLALLVAPVTLSHLAGQSRMASPWLRRRRRA